MVNKAKSLGVIIILVFGIIFFLAISGFILSLFAGLFIFSLVFGFAVFVLWLMKESVTSFIRKKVSAR